MRIARILAAAALLAAVVGCDKSIAGSGRPDAAAGITRAAPAWPAGLVHKNIATRNHTTGKVRYADSPPMGGNHNPVWADCTGTVYTHPVPNENAVHSLEHGAVWVTYRPGLDASGLAALRKLVVGKDYTFLSPYPRLNHAVSVQSWGYQLKTDDPTDPRLARFVTTYRENPKTTPEAGGTCVNPDFPGS